MANQHEIMQRLLEQYKPAQTESPNSSIISLFEYLLPGDVEEKVANGTYPTPKWLIRNQQKFGRAVYRPVSASQKLSNSLPTPQPSSRLKEQLFQQEQFQQLDARVKLVLPNPQQDWHSLAAILFDTCSSDLHRLRAIFYFVACVDVDAAVAAGRGYSQAIRGGPYDVISRMRSEKLQDDVFEKLLEHSQIPFKRLRGFKKGISWTMGLKLKQYNGIWFACFVAGEWRLVDMDWGSSCVSNFSDGQYREIDEASGSLAAPNTRKSGELVYQCNEDYFLTDPTQLVLKHFPPDQQWQLLVRPLTEMEFWKMVRVYPESEWYFQLDVLNCPFNVVITDTSGVARLEFKELTDTKHEYDVKVSLHVESYSAEAADAIKKQATASNTERLKLISRIGNCVSVKITPPAIGQYLLEIFGHLHNENYILYKFVLHCPQANPRPLPPTEMDEFGYGLKAEKMGISGDAGGEVAADDGEISVQVRNKNNIKLTTDILSADADLKIDADRQLLQWSEESGICVHFLASASGLYALVLRSENGEPICQFLIEADIDFLDGGIGQLPDIRGLGGLGTDFDMKQGPWASLTAETHPSPYLRIEYFSIEIRWTFKAGDFSTFDCEMVAADGSIDLSGYNFTNKETEQVTFLIRLPQADNYMLRLFATPRGQQRQRFFNYLIRAVGVQQELQHQFPSEFSEWQSSELQLEQPLLRKIPEMNNNNSTVFRVKSESINHIEQLWLVGPSGKSLQMQSKASTIEKCIAEIRMPENFAAEGESVFIVRHESDGSEKKLLAFNVESDADRKQQQIAKEQLQLDNQLRNESDKLRKLKQQNYAREKAGEHLLPVDAMSEEKKAELQKQQEELKKKQEEVERMKKEEEDRKIRLKEEEIRRKEEERIKKEEEERKRKEEEERRKKEEEERRKKAEEEEKQRKAAEEKRQRKSRLTEMVQKKNVQGIEKALADIEQHNDADDDYKLQQSVRSAKDQLELLKYEAKLKSERVESEKSHDISELKQLLDEFDAKQKTDKKLTDEELSEIEAELKLCRDQVQKEIRLNRKIVHKLDVDSQSLQELRNYPYLDPPTQKCVTAMLLLQGYYEKRVRRWTRCKPLLKDINSVSDLNVESIHPEMAARAAELLADIDSRELQIKSAAAFAFYEWSMKCVKSVKSLSKANAEAKPANKKRQRKLLNVSQNDEDDYDYEDKDWIKTTKQNLK